MTHGHAHLRSVPQLGEVHQEISRCIMIVRSPNRSACSMLCVTISVVRPPVRTRAHRRVQPGLEAHA